jgi:hypothetical protein
MDLNLLFDLVIIKTEKGAVKEKNKVEDKGGI